jgi:tetratricopeptide (TPR) repeat protein
MTKSKIFKWIIVFTMAFLLSFTLHAQPSSTPAGKLKDSMVSVKKTDLNKAVEIGRKGLRVAHETNDTLMLAVISDDISGIFILMGKYDSARVYIQEAMSWFRFCGDDTNILWCRFYMGITYSLQGLYADAIDEFQQILLSPHINENSRIYSFVLGELGNVYYRQSLHGKAAEYYSKARSHFIHDTSRFITASINLGAVLYSIGIHDSSIIVLQEGLKYAEKSNWRLKKAAILTNLSDNWRELGRFNDAIACIDEAIIIREESGDSLGLSNSYRVKGVLLIEKGAYNLANDYFFKSLKIDESLNIPDNTAATYCLIGECLQYTYEHEAALAYFDQGYEIAIKIGAGAAIETALRGKALSWMALSDTKKAIDFMNRYITVHDSILLIDSDSYPAHKNINPPSKEPKNPLKKLVTFLTISLLICGIILLLYRNRNLKIALKKSANEKNL